MKIKFSVIACTMALLLFAACSRKDDNALQAHDENEMMSIMHDMMSNMDTMTMTNDSEIDFAAMMIMHHQGAIDMSKFELENGQDAEMKNTAQKIIADQTQEIQQLQEFLAANTVNNNVPEFTMEQMENMEKMSKPADAQLITGDTDNDFATLMIVHHESALANAQAYLKYGNDVELKAMATEMIEKQKQEIKELQDWLIANKRE